jgi:hypothetical protein
MDVPLFIRMLEYAREDASTDMDLHDVAEKAIAMSAEGGVLSMDNYEDLVGGGAETEELNEGEDKFFVYTQHTPSGERMKTGKKLARNLTRDEVNVFVKNSQSKYKFPLAWSKDISDDFNINADEDEFPISYGGEAEELDEVGHFKYTSKRGYGDKKVGTYLGKYPIYQDDEGNNYIKTGSGIKDVEDLDQSKVKINESNIKEGISSFLNRVEKGTRMLSDVMSVVLMAKQDGEGAADKAVQMMMDKYGISQEEALQAVTNILKKFERFI